MSFLQEELAIEIVHKKPGRQEQYSYADDVTLNQRVLRIVCVIQHPKHDRIQQRGRDGNPQSEPKYGFGYLCQQTHANILARQQRDFRKIPNVMADSCGHRWRDPERLLNLRKVVMDEVQGDHPNSFSFTLALQSETFNSGNPIHRCPRLWRAVFATHRTPHPRTERFFRGAPVQFSAG